MSDSKKKKNKSKLPKEAIKFAKQLGISLDGLEPEAEEIWNMLNDLSNKSPQEYQDFVASQLKEGKDGDSGNKSQNLRSFRPDSGFCIKSTTLSGDGIKVRDVDSEGKKIYINICSSKVVEPPRDKDGNIVENQQTADGLSVPLAIGEARNFNDMDEECLAIDVILNPVIISMCLKEKYFKKQIVDLSIDWIKKDKNIECSNSWDYFDSVIYKGGRGENNDIPVLFFVDLSENQNELNKKDILKNTSSLLSEIKSQEIETSQMDHNISLNPTKESKKETKKTNNPIIQDISKDQPDSLSHDDESAQSHTIQNQIKNDTELKEVASKSIAKIIPSKNEYKKMESLLENLDEEFSQANPDRQRSDLEESAGFLNSFSKIALPSQFQETGFKNKKKETSPVDASKHSISPFQPPAIQKISWEDIHSDKIHELIHIRNSSSSIKIEMEIQNEASGMRKELIATFSGFQESLGPSDFDLMVSEKEIKLDVNNDSLSISHGKDNISLSYAGLNTLRFDLQKVKASLKKRKNIFVVRIGLLLN